MNTNYFFVPASKSAEIADLANRRGVCLEELVCEEIDRMEQDAGWKNLIAACAGHVMGAMNAGMEHEHLWPKGPNAAVAVAAVICEVREEIFNDLLLTMSETDLAMCDHLSKALGVDYDELVSRALTAIYNGN